MLTTRQHHILRHSLGLTSGDNAYRNRFITGPGSKDYPDCEALVAMGLMRRRDGNELSGGDPVYAVTEEGITAARNPPGGPHAER